MAKKSKSLGEKFVSGAGLMLGAGLSSKPKPVKSGTSPSEDSAGIKKFRKDLAAERKFQSEMGQIRNTVGLQPGAGATEYKGPKRESPRERRQREMKQYSVSRTKTAPAKKPETVE